MTPEQGQNGASLQREAILAVATSLFGERGYAGTTMRDIARGAGTLAGTLYVHIDNKEALLFEIVQGGIEEFHALALPLARSQDPADVRFRRVVKGHVQIVAANPSRTLVVFHQWRYLRGEKLARVIEQRRRYEDAISAIVRDGIADGTFAADLDERTAVLSTLGALNWTPEWYSSDGPADAEELGERVADSLLRGILAGG
jgi:AcrR family transcriptional regulator